MRWTGIGRCGLRGLRGEEGDARFGAGNEEFDPALGGGEGLIGDDFEAESLGEEFERDVLVTDGDADEFDAANHAGL